VYQQHQGIDLVAVRGQPVTAAGDGVVIRAEHGNGHGNHVEVDHGGGVMTRYSHLSAILVVPGVAVKQGESIGLAGDTGLATGVHLHFELWRSGQAVDPLVELGDPEQAAPVANR
jgi:murein DD-endopeptidase MepM/ murein hydrolase activator NlpD